MAASAMRRPSSRAARGLAGQQDRLVAVRGHMRSDPNLEAIRLEACPVAGFDDKHREAAREAYFLEAGAQRVQPRLEPLVGSLAVDLGQSSQLPVGDRLLCAQGDAEAARIAGRERIVDGAVKAAGAYRRNAQRSRQHDGK